MDASLFDTSHYPTCSVQEGHTLWAATYDEMKAGNSMDYPLLAHIQAVDREQAETAADLACGTGRIGVWLKERGVRLLDGVDLTEAMLEQARAKGIYRTLQLSNLSQTPLGSHSYDLVSVGLADEHLLELLPLCGVYDPTSAGFASSAFPARPEKACIIDTDLLTPWKFCGRRRQDLMLTVVLFVSCIACFMLSFILG